jgi:hypothetical protein
MENKMTLELTTQIKSAIHSVGISSRLCYYNDKRVHSRRYKFYNVTPTEQQVADINQALKRTGIKAVASINKQDVYPNPYTSYFSSNKLVITVPN